VQDYTTILTDGFQRVYYRPSMNFVCSENDDSLVGVLLQNILFPPISLYNGWAGFSSSETSGRAVAVRAVLTRWFFFLDRPQASRLSLTFQGKT
jgi:hypothetical protein